jgi:hypothetical protein
MVIGFHIGVYIAQNYTCYTTNVNSNPTYSEVIKFVSNLRQVCGFLWGLCFPPPIKLTATI